MTWVIELVFWLCVAIALYPYVGYPLLLLALRRGRTTEFEDLNEHLPPVSVIVTAHNAADLLPAKINNALSVDYPRESYELIVVSDGSSDNFDTVVAAFAGQILVVKSAERIGLAAAQGLGVAKSSGELIVFSDVGASASPDHIRQFVRRFQDENVFGVSGVDRIRKSRDGMSGEAHYVHYEMGVRQLESEVRSLIGMTGPLFAVRRSLCEPWDEDGPTDFQLALEALRRGGRCISAAEIVCEYSDLKNEADEYQRKYRTVLRGLWCVWRYIDLLNPWRHPWPFFAITSHKLLRWGQGVPLAILFPCSLWLAGKSGLYALAAASQSVFYAAAFAGLITSPWQRVFVFRLPAFYVATHVAALRAVFAFLRRRRLHTWTPSHRKTVEAAK